MKTASVPTAAAPEKAESSHNSITVTSHIPNVADEARSSVSFGRSYTWYRQHPHSGEPHEAQTLKAWLAHISPKACPGAGILKATEMASNVLGKQDWGQDGRDIVETNLPNTHAEHSQQKPTSYRTHSWGVQNSPETAPLQGEVLTHTILWQRGVVPQESGTSDKFQEDESRETETACWTSGPCTLRKALSKAWSYDRDGHLNTRNT